MLSRALCVLFALIGLVPPLAAALTRWGPVRDWAASETTRLLDAELGIVADYRVRLSLWPLGLELRDVTLYSNDGGAPALVAPRLTIRPRLFALLSGRVDAGQISIEEPSVRVVVKNGALVNLALTLPERSPGSGPARLPNVSVAITDARFSGDIEGVQVESPAIDLDLFADGPDTLEVALRAATTSIVRERPRPDATAAVDEDVVCQVDARVRLAPGEVLVRRLSLLGVLDASDAPNSSPNCDLASVRGDPRRVLMRLSALRVQHDGTAPRSLGGHVLLQVPLEAAARVGGAPNLTGWVQINGELDVTGRSKLPEFHGRLRTGRIGLDTVSAGGPCGRRAAPGQGPAAREQPARGLRRRRGVARGHFTRSAGAAPAALRSAHPGDEPDLPRPDAGRRRHPADHHQPGHEPGADRGLQGHARLRRC